MSEAIEFSAIRCDEVGCEWEQEIPFASIPDWHNKPCPQCSSGVVVSDEDMAVWHMLNGIVHFQQAIDPDGELPRETLRFDTGALRAKP